MIELESIEHDYIRNLNLSLTSKCQLSPERIVLDLESEVMRGLSSIPAWGNIFHCFFLFSCSKATAANSSIIAILVHFEKNSTNAKCQT